MSELKKWKKTDIAAGLFFVLLPLFVLFLSSVRSGRTLFGVVPSVNDEIDYWRQMYCFDRCGFAYGKNGWVGYQPSYLGSFGCHGFIHLAAWGWFSLLFGWGEHSIIIANFIMLTFSFLVFVLLVKPEWKLTLILILLTLSFRPLILYMNSSLMEVPCYAHILLFMTFLIKYQEDPDNRVYLILCILWTALCTMLRVCYIVLLFPAIMISNHNRIDLKLILKMILYVILFLSIYYLYIYTTAEYPSAFLNDFTQNGSFIGAILLALKHLLVSVRLYFVEIYERAYWFVSNYASFSQLRYLLFVRFPELFFTIRIYNVILLIVLLLSSFSFKKDTDGSFFHPLPFYLFIVLLTFNAGILALYGVSGWVDTRVISSLLYGISVWILVKYYSRFSRGIVRAVTCFLIVSSLFVLQIYLPTDHVETDLKKYPELFSVLEKYGIDSMAMDLETVDSDDSFAMSVSIPPQFGVRIYTDEAQLKEYEPNFVYSDHELELPGYEVIGRNENGIIYKKSGVSEK